MQARLLLPSLEPISKPEPIFFKPTNTELLIPSTVIVGKANEDFLDYIVAGTYVVDP